MVFILAGILYVVWGRHMYNGPLVNLPGVMVDTVVETETDDAPVKEKM